MDEWVSKIQINAKKINDLICSSFFAWHGIEAANMQRRSCDKNIVGKQELVALLVNK